MENPTSFDLNQAIQKWRENLAQSPAFRNENLEELESHLRDSIDRFESRGLTAEEGFLIATRRIGGGGALEVEFGKLNRQTIWLDRALWMLIGILVWGVTSGFTVPLVRTALGWGWSGLHYNFRESGLALPIIVFTLAQALAIAANAVLCWWLIVRKGHRLGARLAALLTTRTRLVATCVGFSLLSIFVFVLSRGLQAVLVKYMSVATVGSIALFSTYAGLIIWPVEIVAMIFLIVVLARKRLEMGRT